MSVDDAVSALVAELGRLGFEPSLQCENSVCRRLGELCVEVGVALPAKPVKSSHRPRVKKGRR